MKIIPDNFWNEIKDLFENNNSKTGRPSMSPRKALSGIIYTLKNGSTWRCMPRYFGKPSTVHETFVRWIRNGKFESLISRARSSYLANQSEFPMWFAIDSSSSKAPLANWSGSNPTDRRKQGVKKTIIVDRYGVPFSVSVGPANRHDSQFFKESLAVMHKFDSQKLIIIAADSAYDSRKLKKFASDKGIVLYSATNRRRNKNLPIIKPGNRWIVEASHSWLNSFRSLKICWARNQKNFLAQLQLAASILIFKKFLVFG